jgi:hypothetical protein
MTLHGVYQDAKGLAGDPADRREEEAPGLLRLALECVDLRELPHRLAQLGPPLERHPEIVEDPPRVDGAEAQAGIAWLEGETD